MKKIKSLKNKINIKNKRIILRSDLNVPIRNEIIQDNTRINLSIPLIENLLEREAKVLLISHLGRPKDFKDKNLSLKPVYKYIKEKISNNIYFYSDKIINTKKFKISFLKKSEIIFFENIRLNDGEIKNDDNFAKNLSSLGDVILMMLFLARIENKHQYIKLQNI